VPLPELCIARVSHRDGQNPALQLDALKRAYCDCDVPDLPWLAEGFKDDKLMRQGLWECRDHLLEIHWEKVSSMKPLENRPITDAVIKKAQRGQRITCWKLDRLGRTTVELVNLIEQFHRRGVEFRCLTANFDTTTAMGRAMLGVMIVFAQLERDINSERTKAGVAMARTDKDGNIARPWGRKSAATEPQLRKARRLMADPNLQTKDVYTALGVSRTTFYRSFVPKLVRPPHPIDQFAVENDDDEAEAG
jgi:DNA invertase Pin-like site-specific DNA recombinase